MRTNQALVIREPGRIGLEERPIPTLQDDEVLVAVEFVALCGSDLKLYRGSYTAPHSYPVVVGHEWLGRVQRVGGAVSDLAIGDAVTGDCSLYCGACAMCGVNRNHCVSIQKRGITADGGCARYIAVKRRHIYRCPISADNRVLVLTEPMSVGITGILHRVPGEALTRAEHILILGGGGIGTMSLLALRESCGAEITLVDPDSEKRAMVDSFGLQGVLSAEKTSALSPGFALVVEAAGQGACLQQAVALAAPAGHIVLLGHQADVAVDFGTAVKKSLTIHASNGSTGGFPRAMEILLKHREIAERLITKTVSLADAPAYIAHGIDRERNIKVVIDLR